MEWLSGVPGVPDVLGARPLECILSEGRIYEGSADPRRAHALPTFLVSSHATTGAFCDAILSGSIAMPLMKRN